VLVLLFALGAGHDLWRAWHPRFLDLDERGGGRGALPGADRGGADGSPWPADSGGAARSIVSRAGDETGGERGPGARRDGGAFRVDVNAAGAAELDALPGVGPVLAERIVGHRQRHGRYRRLEDLLAVRGIGPRLLERLAPHVVFGPGSR